MITAKKERTVEIQLSLKGGKVALKEVATGH